MQLLLEILLYRFSFLQNRYVSFNFYEKWLNFQNWFRCYLISWLHTEVSIVVVSPSISSAMVLKQDMHSSHLGNFVKRRPQSSSLRDSASTGLVWIWGYLEDSARILLQSHRMFRREGSVVIMNVVFIVERTWLSFGLCC